MGAVVTERKQGKKHYSNLKRSFVRFLTMPPEGIFQSTPKENSLRPNLAMAHILGFSSPEELIRERTDTRQQSYVDPAQREEFKRLMEQQNKISGF